MRGRPRAQKAPDIISTKLSRRPLAGWLADGTGNRLTQSNWMCSDSRAENGGVEDSLLQLGIFMTVNYRGGLAG